MRLKLSPDSPVPRHAGACWPGIGPPLRCQEPSGHPLVPAVVVVVVVVSLLPVVLQLAISAATADPLSPDTVVPFSVAHWSRWRQRCSWSRGAAWGNAGGSWGGGPAHRISHWWSREAAKCGEGVKSSSLAGLWTNSSTHCRLELQRGSYLLLPLLCKMQKNCQSRFQSWSPVLVLAPPLLTNSL